MNVEYLESLSISTTDYTQYMSTEQYLPFVQADNCFAKIDMSSGSPELIWVATVFSFDERIVKSNGIQLINIISNGFLLSLPISAFSKKGLSTLSNYGITVNPKYESEFSEYCLKRINALELKPIIEEIGLYIDENSELCFNGYDGDNSFLSITSPKSKNKYYKQLNSVLTTVGSQFAIVCGIAPFVMTLLKLECGYKAFKSFMVHIYGLSSKGKTTFLNLASHTITSYPFTNILGSWLATDNAIIKSLDRLSGIVKCFDESSMNDTANYSDNIYAVSQEKEKSRLSTNLSIQPSGTWSTIVLSTGESSILDNMRSKNNGLYIRCLEFENLEITTNASHCKEIESVYENNGGIILNDLIESMDANSIQTIYESCINSLERKITSDSDLRSRIIKQYAVFVAKAKILNECTPIQLSVENIENLLLQNFINIESKTNIAEAAYNLLLSYRDRNPFNAGIHEYKSKPKVFFTDTLFRDVLLKEGFKDVSIAAKAMDKSGYIIRGEKKRIKSKVNGVYGYTLKLQSISSPKQKFDLSDEYESDINI